MSRPTVKNILNQLDNNKNTSIKRKKESYMPSDEVQSKVQSFLSKSIDNPSMLDNLTRDEQQALVKNHFSKSEKKRING